MSRVRRRVATAVRSVPARRGFALVLVEDGGHHLLSRVDDRRPVPPDVDPAGCELAVREPVPADPAVRDLVDVHDHFHLFRHRS